MSSDSDALASVPIIDPDCRPAASPKSFKDALLKSEIKWGCFVVFMACCMMSIAGLVFINAAQTYVIIDILEYPRESLGNASGSLAFADELLCVPLVSFWGFFSDRIGRGPIMSTGLALMSVAIFLYPFASCVFPSGVGSFVNSLLFFRLLFALGGSATTAMITALIGDYAAEEGRAKVAGFTGTAAGLGALFAVRIFARLPIIFSAGCVSWIHFKRPHVVLAFSVTALALLLTSFVSTFFLARARQHATVSIPLKARIRTGLLAIRRPIIALAYFSGFVARADSIALNLFVGPWIDNYMTKTGICPPRTDPLMVRCEPAKRLTSNLMSTSHLATLLGAPIFGILSDRLGPVNGVALPALLGFLSFGGLFMSSQPDVIFVYVAMFCSGLADIGMIISSMSLIASQSSASQRGALAGMFSLFGAVGIIITSKLGGYLFDSYSETASFSVVAVSSGLLFVSLIVFLLFRRDQGNSLI